MLVLVFGVGPSGFPSCTGPPAPDHPKSLSFFLSRPYFRSFCLSLGVFSLNFGGVFEGWDPQMCTFGLSGCRVKPRRGFTRQPKNSKRAHLMVPTLQTPLKFHENTLRETQTKMDVGKGKKKNAKFWASHPSLSHLRSPTLQSPTFRGPTLRGPTLRGPALRVTIFSGFGLHPLGHHHDTHRDRNGLAKNGLAKIGQIRMAKWGLAKVGPFRGRRVVLYILEGQLSQPSGTRCQNRPFSGEEGLMTFGKVNSQTRWMDEMVVIANVGLV